MPAANVRYLSSPKAARNATTVFVCAVVTPLLRRPLHVVMCAPSARRGGMHACFFLVNSVAADCAAA